MSEPRNRRRSSLFKQNGDPTLLYREKLKAEIAKYVEYMSENKLEDQNLPKENLDYSNIKLSSAHQEFLDSMPDYGDYVRTMTEFLDQHHTVLKKLDEIKAYTDNLALKLLKE